MIGVFWSLAMAAMFGFSQLASRKGLTQIAVDQGTFIMVVVSTAMMALPFFWSDGPALIQQAGMVSLAYFMLAGIIHFVGGFTFMNKSISIVGAARTGSLIATTPLFATFFAAVTLQELINLPMIAGVFVVVAGVLLISSSSARTRQEAPAASSPLGIVSGLTHTFSPDLAQSAVYGLMASVSWGFTPVLIKKGLEDLPSPLVGLTLAMTTAGVVHLVILSLRGRLSPLLTEIGSKPARWQALAGTLVGLGTLFRWIALSYTTAAIVTTLSRASLLITVGLGGLLLGKELEHITSRVRWGAVAIVIGATLVVLFGRP